MNNIVRIIAVASMATMAGALRAGSSPGVVVIANEDLRQDHISAAALKNVYTGRTNYWEGGQIVVIAVLSGQTDDALNEVSGMDASQFRTFWQRLVFSGRGQEPRSVSDAGALVALVASTRGAIALAPVGLPLKGVKILEVQ
jgi:hypothetical protein